MTDAQTILKMIEAASPLRSDMPYESQLDEIDARVECYRLNISPQMKWYGDKVAWQKYLNECKRYTRSRDALKSIRPEGWWFDLERVGDDKFYAHLQMVNTGIGLDHVGPTEELAELHAIIQAIAYERGQP